VADCGGKKVLRVRGAWGGGCRNDLPVWQALHEDVKAQGFTVLAVAMDARTEAARPWIEAARPTYPCLVDHDHRVAELYNMVNVPQAVWIDETGRIVRPTESAGAYEGFRAMDRATRKVPDDVAQITTRAKRTYVEAVRDWVLRGDASRHVFDAVQAAAHLTLPDDRTAEAHAHFRLGQFLRRRGETAAAETHFAA